MQCIQRLAADLFHHSAALCRERTIRTLMFTLSRTWKRFWSLLDCEESVLCPSLTHLVIFGISAVCRSWIQFTPLCVYCVCEVVDFHANLFWAVMTRLWTSPLAVFVVWRATVLTILHLLCRWTHVGQHIYTRLTAFCPWLPRWAGTRKVKPIRQWVTVASAGPYASLHLAADR